MSALDFANSFAQALQPSKSSQKPQKKENNAKTTKFSHSPNIILKHGTYKGYYGYVKKFEPGLFEVQFQEEQKVTVQQYGEHPIGSTILTVFGNSTITNRLPILYGIKFNSAGQSEFFFTESQLTKVVKFKDTTGSERIGKFLGSGADGTCEVGVFDANSFDELAKMYRSSDVPISTNDNKTIECSQIISETFVVSYSPTNKSDINFIGMYGPLLRVVPEQYVVSYPKTVNKIAKSLVSVDGKKLNIGSVVTIKHGPYKGQRCVVVGVNPPQLAVFIDAIGREVHSHLVKVGDTYKELPITPDDVFYMDIKLKSGQYVQVVSLLEDGNIIGIIKGSDYIPKKISADLIDSYQPGFKFQNITSEFYPEPKEPENVFVSEEENQQIEETDDQEDTDNPEFEISEEQEEQDRYIEEEETKYKSSYKDTERTNFPETKWTNDQTLIKATIDLIVNASGLDIDVYAIINNVEKCFTILKKQVMSLGKGGKYWKRSDEKYIIACLVLFSVVQSGFTHVFTSHDGDMIGNFLRDLQTQKFFHKKDINGSIFLTNGWSDEFTVDVELVKALHSSKTFDSIYRIMFENCNAVLQRLFGPVILTSNFSIDNIQLIPLGAEYEFLGWGRSPLPKEPTQVLITVPNYLNGNIPSSAIKILFGHAYQDILEKYKENLAEAINTYESSTSKKVYGYILDNVERMPFALKELQADFKTTSNKLTKLKYEKMLKIWKLLLAEIKERYHNVETNKAQINQEIEYKREKAHKRRADAIESNSLTDQLKELNIDNDDDDIVDRKVQDLAKKYKKMSSRWG